MKTVIPVGIFEMMFVRKW